MKGGNGKREVQSEEGANELNVQARRISSDPFYNGS